MFFVYGFILVQKLQLFLLLYIWGTRCNFSTFILLYAGLYTEGDEKMYTHFGRRYLFFEITIVAVAWSLESLASNPAARVLLPARSGILILVLGLSVCPLSVFCPVLSSAEAYHTFREARHCLVFC